MELDDEDRNNLLQMDAAKMVDVARFCNRYPNIEFNYQVKDEEGREGPVSELVFFFFFVIFLFVVESFNDSWLIFVSVT